MADWQSIEEVDLDSFPDAKAVLDAYLAWFRSQYGGNGPTPDLGRLTRLEQLRRG